VRFDGGARAWRQAADLSLATRLSSQLSDVIARRLRLRWRADLGLISDTRANCGGGSREFVPAAREIVPDVAV
jgi:hypothetical protein